ncbi:MAG: hypothetical protein WBD16_03015 [Pyrinomonadaceae bacterium]
MKLTRNIFFVTATCIFSMFTLMSGDVTAQPTDAQIIKDLTAPKTVKVTLGKPGKIEWFKTYSKWAWSWHFTSKLKTDDPEVFVIVKGYIVYDTMGGKYVKWRTFTTSNSYEGLPDPTAAAVQALISKFGVEQFMGNYYFNRIVGKVESIGLAAEPEYEWHTPSSVSLNVSAVYTERTNDVGGKQRLERTFRIRFYRDTPKSDWKSLLVTSNSAYKNL